MRVFGRALLLAALVSLLLTGCRLLPESLRPPEGNRIAYVGDDGAVYTVRPDGSARTLITSGGERVFAGLPEAAPRRAYRWAAWSPDGGRLAVIAGEADGPADALVVASARGGGLVRVLAERGLEPIFAAWSPDGRRLAALVRGAGQVGLRVVEADGVRPAREVAAGPSVYFSWFPDGRFLLVHTGGDPARNEGGRLVRFDAVGSTVPTPLGPPPLDFHAPAVRKDGQALAYAAQLERGGGALVQTNPNGGDRKQVTSVRAAAAALWSPKGDWLAYGFKDQPADPAYGGLQIWQAGSRPVKITADPVVAFFWAPDGEHLAYVGLDPSSRTFAWWLAGTDGGTPERLVGFTPTRDELFMLTFFDQFAQAVTPWAPDGRSLVYVEASQAGAATGRVQVVGLADRRPRPLAVASLATWSWH